MICAVETIPNQIRKNGAATKIGAVPKTAVIELATSCRTLIRRLARPMPTPTAVPIPTPRRTFFVVYQRCGR
jgi:hypothetical protein